MGGSAAARAEAGWLIGGKVRGHRFKGDDRIVEPEDRDRIEPADQPEHANALVFGHPAIGVGDECAAADNADH